MWVPPKKVKGDKTAYRKVAVDVPSKAARYFAEQVIPQFLLVASVGASANSGSFYLALKGETETARQQPEIQGLPGGRCGGSQAGLQKK